MKMVLISSLLSLGILQCCLVPAYGKYGTTLEELNMKLKYEPSEWTLLDRAKWHSYAGNAEQARADYDAAVRKNPTMYQYRADFFEGQQLNELAKNDHNKAVEQDDREIRQGSSLLYGYLGRARFYERQGLLELAERDFDKAVTGKGGKDFDFFCDRGQFFERTGNLESADRDFTRAAGLLEYCEYPVSFHSVAEFFERQGKFDLAREYITKACSAKNLNGVVPWLELIRLRILAESGAQAESRKLATDYLDKRPKFHSSEYSGVESGDIDVFYGALNVMLGKPSEAMSFFAKYRSDVSLRVEDRFAIARAEELAGDSVAAKEDYKLCLKMFAVDPSLSNTNSYLIVRESAKRRLAILGESAPALVESIKQFRAQPYALIALAESGEHPSAPSANSIAAVVAPKTETTSTSTASTTSTGDSTTSAVTTAVQPSQGAVASSKNTPVKDKWALVIGISKFSSSKDHPGMDLKYAAKDAQDFYNYLTQQAKFPKDHVLLLLDERATRRNIMAAFGAKFLPAVVQPGDQVVIYVSTHGTPANKDPGKRNFIVAYDTEPDSLYETGVNMDELYGRVKEGVKTDRALIVMDTCFSGAGIPGARGVDDVANFDAAQIAQGFGHLVVSSSAPNERSWESKVSQNGVFTKYLIQNLQLTKGNLKQAFEKLTSDVQWEVQNAFNQPQHPKLGGQWEGTDFNLSVVPGEHRPILNPDLIKFISPAPLVPPTGAKKK